MTPEYRKRKIGSNSVIVVPQLEITVRIAIFALIVGRVAEPVWKDVHKSRIQFWLGATQGFLSRGFYRVVVCY